MPKVSKKNLGEMKKEVIKDFWAAINSLTGVERIVFLSHILTPTEIKMVAKRLAILKELKRYRTYHKISEKYGVMANTIGRMSNILHQSGEEFSAIIEKLIPKPPKPQKRSYGSRTMAGTRRIFGL